MGRIMIVDKKKQRRNEENKEAGNKQKKEEASDSSKGEPEKKIENFKLRFPHLTFQSFSSRSLESF
jgi:hypothetical protein